MSKFRLCSSMTAMRLSPLGNKYLAFHLILHSFTCGLDSHSSAEQKEVNVLWSNHSRSCEFTVTIHSIQSYIFLFVRLFSARNLVLPQFHKPYNSTVLKFKKTVLSTTTFKMRNVLCFAFAVGSVTAIPLNAAYENQEDVNAVVDRGVVRYPPHGYPGHPSGGCSGSRGYPPWSATSTVPFITPTPFPTSSQASLSSSSSSPTPNSPSSGSAITLTSTTVYSTIVTRTSKITTSSVPVTSPPSSTSPRTGSGASTATTCSVTASPPAPTQPGVVDGCSKWYVAQTGDFCYEISEKFGITLNTFFSWNPAVLPPDCTQLLAGDAYCVQICGDTTFTTVSTSYSPLPTPTNSAPLPSLTQGPHDSYKAYCGDGSVAQGWPSISQWLQFDYL
jgi:LysM repeat protein